MRPSCGTASSGNPTAADDKRPARERSSSAPAPPIASSTPGPISMCHDSGGIQDSCADWLRLNTINGNTPTLAHPAATAQRARTPRSARVQSKVARCAARIMRESQFSRLTRSTAAP
ncbi:hypothetical protein SY2F82_03030 [Streptomyces sp. Y2F8-2]|nr:hypothetical protein SY2F82_03030 [Streptomyces sp. Y2F8-2]